MANISQSVGAGCKNDNLGDAVTVQLLLNHHISFDVRLHKWLEPFPSTGKIDGSNVADPTVTAVIIFQREIMGFPKPDGRVDPGGKTIKALAGPIGAPTSPSPKSGPSTPSIKTSDPTPLTGDVSKISFGGSQEVKTGLGTFKILDGNLYKAVDGDRLVTAIISGEVVYALLRSTDSLREPGVYSQILTGFVSDVTIGAAAADIVTKTRAIHTAIQIELYLLCGVAIGISTPAALFSFGSSVGGWITLNQKNFPKWRKQAAALIAARATLKRDTPVLYDVLYWKVLKGVAKNIPAAWASDSKAVAKTTGEWVGRLGSTGFNGAFRLAGTLFAILWPALKASAGATTTAWKKALEDELIDAFVKEGRVLSADTAEKIQAEVIAHRSTLEMTFKNLYEAFEE